MASKDHFKIPEKQIQKDIIDLFHLRGWLCFKVGSYRGKAPNTGQDGWHYVRTSGGFNGGKGIPDLLFCDLKGRWYVAEVKTAFGKLRPEQKMLDEELKKRGSRLTVFRSSDDAERFIDKIEKE